MRPPKETPRLMLREMSLADMDFVAAMLADPEVMRFWPRCYTRDEAEAWVRRQQERYTNRPFWRRGFATEAAAACRDFAFVRLGRTRAVTLIRPENVPSQGVARKLGMEPEKLILHSGLPHWIYSVSRSALGA